ncbi:potassium transporter Kup [Methylococcus sp. EFPC2]|uniref:potassium transporter Kup n=1 Tax=Methylococcus sp. EFPC2 TaxID=2812648 RepID=UPI001967A434|nr:potassium transporter Kup [Methylococcus sp. EFPC2]QSA96106.1 potassium transporter Kup [Methylococcus sp. EFPC2]
MSSDTERKEHKSGFPALTLGAIGVVYGDVGTSPLYTMKEVFNPAHGLALDAATVYGAVSLIFWALVVVICLKYVIFVMRADNRGEGGIMALMALALRKRHRPGQRAFITTLGLFGAALFYGDGMITPAISVLSAAEGLEVAAPSLQPYVIPITITVLIGLFLFQSLGTERVGKLFGPIMCLWFVVIGWLGARSLAQNLDIVDALHPRYAFDFMFHHQWYGFLALGAVVLALTGAEALYADMGHFGRGPIRLGWIGFVMPALLLNYLGQAALILREPSAVANPFYLLCPPDMLYLLIGLATLATIIASQAVISGAFSITRQAVQLDYLPRQHFVHTSESEIGQIYAPDVNRFLLVAVVVLVLVFQSSSHLASAYGFAVTGTMAIDTTLAFIVALDVWKWSLPAALIFLLSFLTVDLSFLSANAVKLAEGGWFPLLIGALLFLIMKTWRKGRQVLNWRLQKGAVSLKDFLAQVEADQPPRVPGTAMFLYSRHVSLPFALLKNLEFNKMIHERVILLTVETHDVPYVAADDRLQIEELGQNFYRITIHIGFTQAPNVIYSMALSYQHGFDWNPDDTYFYFARETLIPSPRPEMNALEERLFIFMTRNASNSITFFRVPTQRAIEISTLVEI